MPVIDQRNLAALCVSFAVIAAVLAIGMWASRAGRTTPWFVRTATHVGAGVWVIPTTMLFTSWQWGILPAISFVPINWLLERKGVFGERAGSGGLAGAVLFPLSFAAVLAIFWRPGSHGDLAYVAIAAILAMAVGDSSAAIAGRRFGRHRYRVWSQTRSVEGSAAMLAATTCAVVVVLVQVGGMEWDRAMGTGVATAGAATLAEALSPGGTDNVTVPAAAAAVLYALS